MQHVAIIGAGDLGGAIASRLATRGTSREIRLIDEAVGVASGKALDILQAGPIARSDTKIVAHSAFDASAGAAVVVLADRPGSGATEWSGEGALAIVRRLLNQDPDVVILCAGPSSRWLVERGVLEVGARRRRLIGTAPEALRSALRALVALETESSPKDVSLAVLGVPPSHTVVPWSEASVAGAQLAGAIGAHQLARMERRVPALWPPGPYALASATVRAIEAVLVGSRQFISGFVLLDGELGVRRRAAAFPIMLGPGGVTRIATPSLSGYERTQFDNAVAGS